MEAEKRREEMTPDFNPQMLTVGRQSRGLTQAALAKASGISVPKISKIENGLILPSEQDRERFSSALNYPPTFFTQKQEMTAVGQSIYHRMRKIPKKHLDMIEATLNIRHMHIRKLFLSAEFEERDLPFFEIDELGPPEEIAESLRNYWHVPRGPVSNLTGLLEGKGAIVILFDFKTKKIDGETITDGRHPPVVFVNSNLPPDKQRWTLAHELGHLIMHRIPSQNMEKEADHFASEFLMPGLEILPMLRGGVSLQSLYDLKLHWRVPMASVVMRACALGILTEGQKQYWFRILNAEGYLKREPGEAEVPREYPEVAKDLVKFHLETLEYSPDQLRDLIGLYEAEFRSTYLSGGRRLALVS